MRDFYLILNIVVAITLFVLGVATLINNRKLLLNRLFLAFTICVGVWLIAACVSNDTRNTPTVSLYGNYCVFFFSYFSSYLLLWFSALISASGRTVKVLKRLFVPVILIGLLSATPLVVRGVELQDSVYGVVFGPLVALYGLTLFMMLCGSLWVLFVGVKRTDKNKKIQLKAFLWSLVISIPILLVTQFIVPSLTGSFDVTDVGILIMALPVASLYQSVIKHGLFDIRRAVVRSMAYVLALVILAFIYYGITYLVSILILKNSLSGGTRVSPLDVFIALLLAFMFQPIRIFFDKVTNSFFYKDQYISEEFFANLSRQLAVTNDLHNLLTRAVHEITNTLKSSYGAVEITIDSGVHFAANTKKVRRIPLQDIATLDEYISQQKKQSIIATDWLDNDSLLYRMLTSHKIALALPLMKGSSVIGYLFLGEHRNGVYRQHDIAALEAISDELVIAIQHALSVQEVKELNATLQQRVDEATKELRASNQQLRRLDEAKDEFVSMASHQLRTPLTSVKGYISMLLEGDAGQINDTQKHFLNEAFTSSERMVHLINDFLNVSRLQTGKFIIDRRKTDLKHVVTQEVDSLRTTAGQRQLTLKLKLHGALPPLYLDESKIRQVIMNFIDNALYYSAPGTTVLISLGKEAGEAVLTVKDTGIGVPPDEQAHLFTKFYRASNARKQRPDGTGVGLFLAKKVVVAHGGSMIFTSEEGKGSTFGFALPIAKLERAPADNADNLDN